MGGGRRIAPCSRISPARRATSARQQRGPQGPARTKVDAMSEDSKAPEGKIPAVSVSEVASGCYALMRDGFPTIGAVRGDEAILVVDAPPSVEAAQGITEALERISGKPVRYLVLTHYHAGRTAGAHALEPGEILASDLTRRLIEERGEANLECERRRASDGAPAVSNSLVWPGLTFASSLSLRLGSREIRLMHLGRGHTMGDIVVWVPDSGTIFAGDLLNPGGVPYAADGHLGDWVKTLERLRAFKGNALVAGSGTPLRGAQMVNDAITRTKEFIETLRASAAACVDQGLDLKATNDAVRDAMDPRYGKLPGYDRVMPLNIARAYDEAKGIDVPQIWTAEREQIAISRLSRAAASEDAA